MWKFPILIRLRLLRRYSVMPTWFSIRLEECRPRMVRGTMVKNCRKWFRPVVATLSAEGVGQDTADVSYRRFGL
jgi:hypothetical protein